MRILTLLWLAGCSGSGTLATVAEPGPLALTVTSPAYGTFAGDSPTVTVSGHTTRPDGYVWVEGRRVNVGPEGNFSVELPVDGDWRTVDVEASAQHAGATTHLRERIPVFAGHDPMASWTGGVGVRATPELLAGLGDVVEDTIDALGWEDLILGVIPAFESSAFSMAPTSVTHAPLDVDLVPADGGVIANLTIPDFELTVQLDSDDLGLALPVTIGYDRIEIGATLVPSIEQGSIALALTTSAVDLGTPIIQIGGIDPVFLEGLLGGVDDWLSGLGELLVDLLLGFIPEIALPPLETSLDLFGMTVSTSVTDFGADTRGIYAALGVGFGEKVPAPGVITIPEPLSGDVAVALHEGLFQQLLASDLLALLEQDLVLAEPFASALSLPLAALPGGGELPAATGWCLDIGLGDARLARVRPGTDALAKLYLPDVDVSFAYNDATHACQPWLTANLAMELDVVADGTVLGFDLNVPDGAVLYYGASVPVDEDEVVATLGASLSALLGLLGGTLEIDLADMLGGASGTTGLLGGLSPRISGSETLPGPDGAPVAGVVVLDVEVF